jgi:protein-S-isoprenylcysteine O-methyltransferase Ste14
MQRLLPPILVLLLLASMGAVHHLWPGSRWLSPALRPWGAVPLGVGIALLVTARLQFARHRTNIMTFGQPNRLVTTGAFALSRNPMYLGFALVLVGASAFSGGLSALLLALVFLPVADRWYIPYEERLLAQAFGTAWEDYKRRVRRWL